MQEVSLDPCISGLVVPCLQVMRSGAAQKLEKLISRGEKQLFLLGRRAPAFVKRLQKVGVVVGRSLVLEWSHRNRNVPNHSELVAKACVIAVPREVLG